MKKVSYRVVIPGYEREFGYLYKGKNLKKAREVQTENYTLLPLIEKYINNKYVGTV
ncbi:MAG: hypothetical protein GX892_00655 [Thermoanaerobacteraceae bacterium]|nr:hypothetical protein [Thermoanaerobacteraceae bacterium]